MTNTHTTQAARRCADLANEAEGNLTEGYFPGYFMDSGGINGANAAFRREVEREHAFKLEVLALLDDVNADDCGRTLKIGQAKALLRTNLLPDPQTPTLLDQFEYETNADSGSFEFRRGYAAFADFIAKRGLDVKPS